MASENLASAQPSPSKKRVCMSIPDTYKCPPLHNPRTHDVLKSIVKGRKSWKTLRGGEIVWPPELEAALLEGAKKNSILEYIVDRYSCNLAGLESYQPDDSRETRLLGRFPMRNRFISEYIFHKTGKRRTAKQVGSRLQQLRDTCGGKRRTCISFWMLFSLLNSCTVLYLLSRRETGRGSSESDNHRWYNHLDSPHSDTDSSSDAFSLPPTPTEPTTNFSTSSSRTVIHIDLLPDNTGLPDSLYDLQLFPTFDKPPALVDADGVRVSEHPRPLRSIDPTVTFLSHSPISATSFFTVLSSGMTVFSETTTLSPAGPPPGSADGDLLYSTTLVPGFWDKLSASSGTRLCAFTWLTQRLMACTDPTQYTIIQEVVKDSPSAPVTMFSAVYKFNYRSKERGPWIESPPLSSALSDQSADDMCSIQPSVPFDSLLSIDSASFMDLDTYFDFDSMESNWSVHSPSDYSSELSTSYGHPQSCGAQRDDLHRLSLSPVDPCFDLYNYASCLICPIPLFCADFPSIGFITTARDGSRACSNRKCFFWFTP